MPVCPEHGIGDIAYLWMLVPILAHQCPEESYKDRIYTAQKRQAPYFECVVPY